jgi:murein tripeptide amidase MpaA
MRLKHFVATVSLLISLGKAELRAHMAEQIPDFKIADAFTKYVMGTLGGVYKTTEEFQRLMNDVVKDFPDVVHEVDVGTTFLGARIPGYLLALNLTSEAKMAEAMQRPAILIDGAHHARELTSVSMAIYATMRLLFGVVHGDEQSNYLLSQTSVLIIPIVNFDGYSAISDHYKQTGKMSYIRKNRNASDL